MDKKNQKISKKQKEKLVEYMSNNLDFARGQFGGVNSNINSKEQWESLKGTLNSLGGSEKTVEQWKKCWIDLKAGVKKQVNARRSFMNRTGGGGYNEVPRDLNFFEEEILKIITVDAVDGDGMTPESGVPLDESMYSIELLDGEEIFPPPEKKKKDNTPAKSSTTTASKYTEAIEASKVMQEELMTEIAKLGKQNEEILSRLSIVEEKIDQIRN